MDASRGYIAQEADLEFKNRKAVLNLVFTIVYDDEDETDFDFPGYLSAYMRIYDEDGVNLLKNFTTQVTRNANLMVLNCSVADMTFNDTGIYYFELGYLNGPYEVAIRYGNLTIIL